MSKKVTVTTKLSPSRNAGACYLALPIPGSSHANQASGPLNRMPFFLLSTLQGRPLHAGSDNASQTRSPLVTTIHALVSLRTKASKPRETAKLARKTLRARHPNLLLGYRRMQRANNTRRRYQNRSRSVTLLPSSMVSAGCVTTTSPTSRPEVTTATRPSRRPISIGKSDAVPSSTLKVNQDPSF